MGRVKEQMLDGVQRLQEIESEAWHRGYNAGYADAKRKYDTSNKKWIWSKRSNCCDAPRWLETDLCSACMEHADFYEDETQAYKEET